MPEKVAGNADRNAFTMAHFSIITAGMLSQTPRLVLYSSKVTVVSMSIFRSERATLAQPPTMTSPFSTRVPFRYSSFSPIWTITPDSIPAKWGLESALLVKASFPTTIDASASLEYLIRYASRTNGLSPMYLHSSRKLMAS